MFTAKIITFFGVELLHSRPMDCHQVKAKRVPNTVTATYSNFKFESSGTRISSGEPPNSQRRQIQLLHLYFLPTATLSYAPAPLIMGFCSVQKTLINIMRRGNLKI